MQDDGRKGDILFPGFGRNGTDLMVDICIANACAKSFVRGSCDTEGYAMNLLETRKIENMNVHIGMLEWTSSP
jgi:hypothetical protein